MSGNRCYFPDCNWLYDGQFNSNPDFGVLRNGWHPYVAGDTEVMAHDHALVNPIHSDRDVQHIDVRLYFPEDVNPEEFLDAIHVALQDSPELCNMISAYQLKNDGFAHLVPDDEPLA